MDSVRALKNSPPDCFLRLRRRAVLISSSQAKSMTLRRIGEGSYLVGEDGFGPSKLNSNRFTVCPLWPLGNSPILILSFCSLGRPKPVRLDKGGAGGRTRTPDLLITNQLLYQLSYTSSAATNIILSQPFAIVNTSFKEI